MALKVNAGQDALEGCHLFLGRAGKLHALGSCPIQSMLLRICSSTHAGANHKREGTQDFRRESGRQAGSTHRHLQLAIGTGPPREGGDLRLSPLIPSVCSSGGLGSTVVSRSGQPLFAVNQRFHCAISSHVRSDLVQPTPIQYIHGGSWCLFSLGLKAPCRSAVPLTTGADAVAFLGRC